MLLHPVCLMRSRDLPVQAFRTSSHTNAKKPAISVNSTERDSLGKKWPEIKNYVYTLHSAFVHSARVCVRTLPCRSLLYKFTHNNSCIGKLRQWIIQSDVLRVFGLDGWTSLSSTLFAAKALEMTTRLHRFWDDRPDVVFNIEPEAV